MPNENPLPLGPVVKRIGILGLRLRIEDLEKERDTLRAEVAALRRLVEVQIAFAEAFIGSPPEKCAEALHILHERAVVALKNIDAARAAGEKT